MMSIIYLMPVEFHTLAAMHVDCGVFFEHLLYIPFCRILPCAFQTFIWLYDVPCSLYLIRAYTSDLGVTRCVCGNTNVNTFLIQITVVCLAY